MRRARTPTSTPERARARRMRGAPYVPPETSCSQATASSKRRRADELRDRLATAGITVADGRDGATWSVG